MKSRKCPVCGKEIKGWNKDQQDYLLMQHILSKHPDTDPRIIREKEKKEIKKNGKRTRKNKNL